MAEQKKPQGPQYPLPPAKQSVLKQTYMKAAQEAAKGQYDYANSLFKTCVQLDPRNDKYVNEFLGNLQKKFLHSRPNAAAATMKTAGTRTMMQKSKMSGAYYDLLKQAYDVVEHNPYDIPILLEMAAAARALEYDDVEYVYLKRAVDSNIKDPTANRRLADCLERREEFDQAIVCWERVKAAEPKDVEIGRRIHNLTVKQQIKVSNIEGAKTAEDMKRQNEPPIGRVKLSPEEQIRKDLAANPKDIGKMMELAQLLMKDERYVECETFLKEMLEKSGGDLNIQEQLEVTQLQLVRDKAVKARQVMSADKTPANIEAYKQALKDEFLYELGYYKARVERYPTHVEYRVEYANRLEKGGKYKEAIEHYQKGRTDAQQKGVVLMGLGRCFAKIGQARLAYSHFKEGVDAIPASGETLEEHKEALYQAGLAAKSMKDVGAAKDFLSRLAGLDFSYKDVSDVLDKLDSEEEDGAAGSSAGSAAR